MFRFMHQVLHDLITEVFHLSYFFIPSTVVIQKTVTLATLFVEPVTVSMLYLSFDLKVILLYLENSSDSVGTIKLKGCL